MSRRGKTYRRIALELIREGRELQENGRDLGELEDRMGGRSGNEARLRVLAGGIVAGVGQGMLAEARHRSIMGQLRRLGAEIRAAIRRSPNAEEA